LPDAERVRLDELTRAVERRQRELAVLAHVAARVHAEDEESAVFEIALDEILTRLGLDAAWIFTGSEGGVLSLAAARGVSQEYLDEIREHGLAPCLCPEVLAQGRPMQARNTTQCPRMPRIVRGSTASVAHACIPLKFEASTVGVLNVAAPPGALFSEDELSFLETLGHQVGLAVERGRHRLRERRLHEASQQAYAELQAAQDRLVQQEKMAVLGTFASGLAHEVRNPLNSIGLQLSVLERKIARMAPQLAPETSELALVIRDEVRRLDRLVSDFLLFARSGRLLAGDGDLDAVAADVITLLAPEADAGRVRIRWDRVGEPARGLRMDAEKIKQVIINLVRNGMEAQPDGGVVVVETGLVDGVARLRVHDAGPGLPDAVDVFQLFVTTKDKGTGLGLSIVQQITQHHGGTIRTGRGALGGASFTIDLPASSASEGERP
jgi:signal transduction histidine kinase